MATSRTNSTPGEIGDPPARWRGRRAGFTLVEILVAIAIAVALLSLTGPPLLRWMGDYRFKETLTQIEAAMARARADAQRTGNVVEVVSRRVGESVRLIARPVDFGDGNSPGEPARGDQGATKERVVFELPSGFVFGDPAPVVRAADSGAEGMAPPPELKSEPEGPATAGDGEDAVLVVFLPDGSAARGPGPGALVDRSGRRAEMAVNSWTGTVSLAVATARPAAGSSSSSVDTASRGPDAAPAGARPRRGRRVRVRRSVRRPARGALLLETMVALAVFVAGGLAVLAMVNRAAASMALARDYRAAADLARSAMAKIEAGIATTQSLNGPVPAWNADDDTGEDGSSGIGSGFADSTPPPSGWELEVTTEPSAFDGLTLVTVKAVRRAGENSERTRASYTLRQLVRMGVGGGESVGDDDPLAERAKGGSRRSPAGSGGPAKEGGPP